MDITVSYCEIYKEINSLSSYYFIFFLRLGFWLFKSFESYTYVFSNQA